MNFPTRDSEWFEMIPTKVDATYHKINKIKVLSWLYCLLLRASCKKMHLIASITSLYYCLDTFFWIIVVTVRSLSTRAAPSASLVFTDTCWLVFVQPKVETATNGHDAILYWFNNGHRDKLLCRSASVCNCTHQKRNRKMKPDTQTTTLAWGRLCFILTTCSIYATAGQVGN